MQTREITTPNRTIKVYEGYDDNIDAVTVKSFGDEWTSFNEFSPEEIRLIGDSYFDIITDEMINRDSVIGDFGCGSGRFSKYWQGKTKTIVGVDPSDAIFAADKLIGKDDNIQLIKASISNLPFDDGHFDFAMSIGVLHHIPDTRKAMKDCVRKVKKGGYFYTYLYYSLDNRGLLFKSLFHVSNVFRMGISAMPQKLKAFSCDVTAVLVYMPFVLLTRTAKKLGAPEYIWEKIPLSAYQDKSFFVIRNDALDRFGTPLEQRFSRAEIQSMMEEAGLSEIVFSEKPGYWHAVGKKN
jgi:ubiquinone/menaquinone biosynthesis C-methylase UbiE